MPSPISFDLTETPLERGRLLLEQGRVGPAVAALRAATALHPDNPTARALLALALEQQHDHRAGFGPVGYNPLARARAAEPPPALLEGLNVVPVAVGQANGKWLVELANETAVRAVRPNFLRLGDLGAGDVMITAAADSADYDFVSRYFAPAAGINEDPVTGSAHCALGPYWAAKLGRNDLVGYQASARGGLVRVGCRADRLLLGGQAVLVSQIELFV